MFSKALSINIFMLVCYFSASVNGQNFAFTPGNNYSAVLEMEIYTESVIHVFHDSPEAADISWRLIENSCPMDWDFQLCDWDQCYSGMPNLGDMQPVEAGNSGFLKVLVNPYNVPGAGTLNFWIFPTGHMEEHVDVFFHFNTIVAGIFDATAHGLGAFYNSTANSLVVKSNTTNSGHIINLAGQCEKMISCDPGTTGIDLTGLSSGMHIYVSPGQTPLRFFIP